ncbi:MAG: site-specific DNA-methyltransferase [Myxococcaceae bacterium]|nr:site-specific DNA-methyltransferase [Myxococcaceae bacterium]
MTPKCVPGDATTAAPYEQALQGARAHVLLTDPPYCLLTRRRKGGDEREPKGRKIDRDPVVRFEDVKTYRGFTEKWLTLAVSHLSNDATLVIWTNLLGKEPIQTVASKLGFLYLHGEYVWAKRTREGNSGEELLRMYEVALVLSRVPKAVPSHHDQALAWAAVAGYDDEGEADTWGHHPHHKPFGVLEPLVRNFSAPGQLVLDPFAGSGSIPLAALRLGRRIACIELKEDWAKRVTARLAGAL